MDNSIRKPFQIAGLGLVMTVATFVGAQPPAPVPPPSQLPPPAKARAHTRVEKEIPRAALLTERGRQLADQLRRLRRVESSMGPKHPSLPDIRSEIDDVKEQLDAWLPGSSPAGANSLADAIPNMNTTDMKQLILRMSAKIDRLERRVNALEKRLEIF